METPRIWKQFPVYRAVLEHKHMVKKKITLIKTETHKYPCFNEITRLHLR